MGINQVSQNSINAKNPFAEFGSKPNGYYFVTPQNQPDTFTPKTQKEKKKMSFGAKIALSALSAGATVLLLMKGLPKGAYKKLDQLSEKLQTKFLNEKAKGNLNKLSEFYSFSLNKLSSFLGKSKAINNFVSIKDITFEKIMSKNKYTQKIHRKITEVYESIGRRTVNKTFDKTKTNIFALFQKFEDADDILLSKRANEVLEINGVKKTVQEWIDEDIELLKKSISRTWNTNFGKSRREARFKQIQSAVKNLSDEVWEETGGHWRNTTKRELYETFIAEEKLADKKTALIKAAKQARSQITRDVNDNYKDVTNILDNITTSINLKDAKSRAIIQEIRNILSDYKKLSGISEIEQRPIINQKIIQKVNDLLEQVNSTKATFKYNSKVLNRINSNTKDITQIVNSDKKGDMQEILTIYKHIFGKDSQEYLQLKSAVRATSDKIDSAILMETDQFFDMMRDLRLGSAPTDILTILAAIGGIGIGLSKSENKDEKYSVLLQAGIPAIGAIATSLYFSASLVSGGKSMLYGALSGLLISKAGQKLDESRKKYFPVNETVKK